MTPAERSEIEQVVVRLIEFDFRIDFSDLFKLAVEFIGEPLFQASDEVRNFLDHAALALTAADIGRGRLDLGRARRHLYYGKYICLLVPTYTKLARLTEGVKLREERRGSPIPTLRDRLESIRLQYNAIDTVKVVRRDSLEEIDRDIENLNSVNRKLEEVLTRLNLFEAEVNGYYWLPGIAQLAVWPALWRMLRWVYHHWIGITIFAIAMNLIAAIIYAFIFDRPIRNYLENRPSIFCVLTACQQPVPAPPKPAASDARPVPSPTPAPPKTSPEPPRP